MNTYIFFRDSGMWYSIELRDDKDAIANAKCNPGTIRVEDTDKKVIWDINNDKNLNQ